MGFYRSVLAGQLQRSKIFVLAFFASVIICSFSGSSCYAEYQNSEGIFTDSNDVRWEYIRQYDTETQKEAVVIKFFDKPADATTIVVPSLQEVLENVPGASQTLDTYFLDDAIESYQAEHYSETKRESTTSINKLDMSNTAKIQILGIRPMIDPEVETELVFGEEMVIADTNNVFSYSFEYCTEFEEYPRDEWRCIDSDSFTIEYVRERLPFWYLLSANERERTSVSKEGFNEYFGTSLYLGYFNSKWVSNGVYSYLPAGEEPDSSLTYVLSTTVNYYNSTWASRGVFEGYKLRLTNFGDFNYVGWYTFKNVEFGGDSKTITLQSGFEGSEIFSGSNVEKVILKTNHAGDKAFFNCSNLTQIEFDESVDTISTEMFWGTNLGDLDFSNTPIKTIRNGAFRNSNLTSINLDGIDTIMHNAFRENNGLTEIYLPKSLNWLGAALFENCRNLKKVTVAYDTMTSGTAATFHTIFDNNYGSYVLEELIVLAPYGEGEEVKPTHVSYEDYKWHYYYTNQWTDYYDRSAGNRYGSSCYTGYACMNEQAAEVQYAHVDTYKNVIAPLYFTQLHGLKKITIGDGFEYIGAMAFWDTYFAPSSSLAMPLSQWETIIRTGNGAPASEENNWYGVSLKQIESLYLPESLKGVGNFAFNGIGGKDLEVHIPVGIEFVGIAAFRGVSVLKEDIDLPNLVFLGDEAFAGTQVRDVYIHDGLQYLGRQVFAHSPLIRNVTIDYDLFNPEKNAFYNTDREFFNAQYVFYDYQRFPVMFGIGMDLGHNATEEVLTSAGINYEIRESDQHIVMKYGTIKFTDKVVTGFPTQMYSHDNSGGRGNYFAYIAADKIDLGDCGWTVIPPYFFTSVQAGEVSLPKKLETIMEQAFNTANIEKELVLPDTVKEIGAYAFNQGRITVVNGDTLKITKLPAALESVGDYAFYDDYNLTADLDSVNLKTIGLSAFQKTGLNNIVLNESLESIGDYAFIGIHDIQDITINLDLTASGAILADYSLASLFNQTEISDTTAGFTANNITFTSKNQTVPNEIVLEVWPYCEHGYYDKYDGTRYCRADDYYGGRIEPALQSQTLSSSYFYGVTANKIDLSNVGWGSLPDNMFNSIKVNEILLPSGITVIPENAFSGAEINGDFKIPDTVKNIEFGAFDFAKMKSLTLPLALEESGWSPFWKAEVEGKITVPDGVKVIPNNFFNGITAETVELPQSIEKIGTAAFFKNEYLDIDLDLPNLKEIGGSAFFGTSLKKVVLHDKMETINSGAFLFIPTLRDITLDCDFYGLGGNWWSFYSIFSSISPENTSQIQDRDGNTLGEIIFTDKNITNPFATDFAFFDIDKMDISAVKWDTLPKALFYKATIAEPLTLPNTIKTVGEAAFQESNLGIANAFSEGLESIGEGAFYAAQVSGDITIPSTVTSIGWSAFNAGDADTHYGTVTIKPALNYDSTDSQAVFQMFWNANMDKLVVESPMLPVLAATGDNPVLPHEIQYDITTNEGTEVVTVNPTLREDGEPEFHAMTMREVEIKNLPVITANAFEECANLEQVSFVNHDSLTSIERYAFNNDTKLKKFVFGNGLAGKNVVLKEYAFNNTAIETIGDMDSNFALTAANFNAVEPHVFSNMPNLKSAYIPGTFSIDASLANTDLHTNGSSIPSYTFADDPELETVEVGYDLSIIHEDAFANDNKLNKIFLWGNTDIEENGTNLTIPEPTNIFAYSDAPGQEYANSDTRSEYSGKFYPLDEVLYLTSNKTYVLLEQDEEGNNIDFNKDGLVLYALRRDGVILESDDWQTYTKAYPRSTVNINFEQGRGGNIGTDENIMWNVYDARKPFDLISLANENYTATSFEFMQMPSSSNPLVAIHYPDGYTNAIRTTTLATMTKDQEQTPEEPEPEDLEVPNTGVFHTISGVTVASFSISAFIILGTMLIVKKAKK